jgi:hypothetical protein
MNILDKIIIDKNEKSFSRNQSSLLTTESSVFWKNDFEAAQWKIYQRLTQLSLVTVGV